MSSLRGRVALVATVVVAVGFAATGTIVLAISSYQAQLRLDAADQPRSLRVPPAEPGSTYACPRADRPPPTPQI